MSQVYQKEVRIGGKNGIVIWDKLCADGPKDPKTNEPLIDPETGEEYPGANDDMAELLHDYLVKVRGPMNLPTGGTVPRFGVLSLLAMKTPIFCYDHPRLKKIANTAFTDGRAIFVDADFMRKLVQQEEDTGGKLSGMLFLLMHELMHKLFAHVGRLKNIPPKIANIAEDLVINGKLIKGFDTIKPVPMLYEIGVGMKMEEADKYHNMSEEVVAEMLMRQEMQKKKKKEQEQKKQKGSSGNSQSGDGDDENEQNDEKSENGEDQQNEKKSSKGDKKSVDNQSDEESNEGGKENKKSKGKGKGKSSENQKGSGSQSDDEEEESEYSPIHHISPEELLEALEEAGLEGPKEALGMPDSSDIEEIGRMKERNKLNIVDAIQTAQAQAMNCSGQYPGKEISTAASETIGGLDKGKIVWKLAMKQLIQGDGQKLFHSDDEAAVPWYLDKETMGIDPFYIGSPIPKAPDECVVAIMDTSGSTSGGTLRREFANEIVSIAQSQSSLGDSARKVFLFSAAEAVLGEPVEITPYNVNKIKNEGVPIFDGGGTDFKNCLDQVLQSKIMKKEKVKAVIYFTDCYDAVPHRSDFESYLEQGIKIVFVTTPGLFNEKWNAELNWAEVYCMEEGTKVDLGKNVNDVEENTRKNRLN